MRALFVLGSALVLGLSLFVANAGLPPAYRDLKIEQPTVLTDGQLQQAFAAFDAVRAAHWATPKPPEAVRPAGDGRLQGPPTISAAEIDAVLTAYGSPAAGSGRDFYDLGVRYGIDPAFALAFFVHESTAGTAPGWAGWKPDGSSTHNVGNIICAGYPTCFGRFRDYGSWAEGIEDWYRLIDREYVGAGLTTLAEVLPVYAPPVENDTEHYVLTVQQLVDGWRRAGTGAVSGESSPLRVSESRSDPVGYNVLSALRANGGALQEVVIPPGASWSFNRSIGHPSRVPVAVAAGVPGGGWCDLAARYLQAARAVLPPEAVEFEHHQIQLDGVPWEDSVAIWNVDGEPGSDGARQDLVLTNTTDRPVRLWATIEAGQVVVRSEVVGVL